MRRLRIPMSLKRLARLFTWIRTELPGSKLRLVRQPSNQPDRSVEPYANLERVVADFDLYCSQGSSGSWTDPVSNQVRIDGVDPIEDFDINLSGRFPHRY